MEFWLAFIGPVYLILVAFPLAKIDFREHRLPNRLVLPAIPITLFGQLASCLLGAAWLKLGQAFTCAILAFTVGLLLNRYATLGMGDVKLIAATSLMLGWFDPVWPLIALFLAFLMASIVILPRLLLRRLSLKRSVALGPYLLAGVIGVFGFLPFI